MLTVDLRTLLTVLLLAVICACATPWHDLPDPYAVSDKLPSLIRVTSMTGEQHVLYSPTLRDSTLVGFIERPYDQVRPKQRSFHLNSVARLEYGDPSTGEKATHLTAISLGIVALAAFVLALLWAASSGGLD